MKSAETYFLATVDENGEPRVRPFGTINLFEDRLYIQTGRKKDVFRQLMNNEHFELCAFKDGEWLRVSGRLLEDPRHELYHCFFRQAAPIPQKFHTDRLMMQLFQQMNLPRR